MFDVGEILQRQGYFDPANASKFHSNSITKHIGLVLSCHQYHQRAVKILKKQAYKQHDELSHILEVQLEYEHG